MDQDSWTAVDRHFAGRLLSTDEAMDDVLAANLAAGLPAIDVSPLQGKFLHLIARAIAAPLGGYSTIWLARAVGEGGHVVSLEFQPRYAEVARSNLERAALDDRVEIRVGPALDLLPEIEGENLGPFDLVFIDADKANQDAYLIWALM